MKTKISRAIAFITMSVILSGFAFSIPVKAMPPRAPQSAENTPSYKIYYGRLIDKTSNDRIIHASIFVQGKNVSTISNDQGEFVLKVADNIGAKNIVITHLGYKNLVVPLSALTHKLNKLYMEPESINLSQIYVPNIVSQIIEKVIANRDKNYSVKPNQMTGFYRESIQKRKTYVSLAEGVVKIYKSSYRGLSGDQVRVVIGRKGSNVKKMDTLLFKLQGGPSTSLLLDIVRNPYVLLNPDMINKYNFSLENEVKIDKHLFYVIGFSPINQNGVPPQYYGKFYIEVGTYALAYAQFHLDLTDPQAAARLFIQKKPAGAKVTPLSADYIVKYSQHNGKWYFNYSKGEATFKVKWKKRLFASTYSTSFELAITDRTNHDVMKFKPRERFKPREIFSESLQAFADDNYWGKYNIIKPNQSIESAIRKFERIIKRHERHGD